MVKIIGSILGSLYIHTSLHKAHHLKAIEKKFSSGIKDNCKTSKKYEVFKFWVLILIFYYYYYYYAYDLWSHKLLMFSHLPPPLGVLLPCYCRRPDLPFPVGHSTSLWERREQTYWRATSSAQFWLSWRSSDALSGIISVWRMNTLTTAANFEWWETSPSTPSIRLR